MRVYKLIRAEAREQMSGQDRPETTAAASAPAREPEVQPTEPRGGQPAANTSASSANAQTGGRRHPRRHRRSGGGGSSSGERGERSGGEQRETQARAAQPERDLNLDELRELSELLNAQGFNEFEIEREGFRLRLSRYTPPPPVHAPTGTQAFVPPAVTPVAEPGAPAQSTTTAPSAETKQADASADEGLHMITSPIVGTFYRSPSPTTEPFVNIGSHVEADTVVCIIEAMKLMNEIQSDVRGTVEKIYVENGQPVEYGQALFGIRK